MNNNKLNTEALLAHCHGVFAKTSHIDVGTSENPLPYASKDILRDSYKGKQFQSNPPKLGRTQDTYFEPLKPLQDKIPFLDRVKYAEAQPEKPKLGFHTADYSRRDEFTLTFRTEQYRTFLKQEDRHAQRALRQLLAPQQEAEALGEGKKRGFLYDMVYDTSSGSSVSSKLKRDTVNPTALSQDRHLGTLKTTALTVHAHPGRAQSPEHGHRPVIESTFYRKANAFLQD